MTREEAIKYIKSRCIGSDEERDGTQWSEAMWMAIEALRNCSEKPNGSLISRQDAIDIVDQFSREEMFHYMESLELDVRATQICHSAIEAVGTIKEQIEALPSAEPKTGECITCGRNADNGGVHEDGRTKCPIQEHYALLLDGYCHLYEPYNCGARMLGEDGEEE